MLSKAAVHLLVLLLALLLASATAQICSIELGSAIPEGASPTRTATALARAFLEAIEPALPQRAPDTAGQQDANALWLHSLGFLPDGWQPDGELTAEQWAGLLSNLQAAYRVRAVELSGRTDREALLGEAQDALERVSEAVRPLAVIATHPERRDEIVSASVIWNWTPWPRLLVFDPRNLDPGSGAGHESALARLGTCAWRPRAYFSTDAETANGYYLGNGGGRIRLLATDAGSRDDLVPEEQETDFFSFRSDLLQDATVAAVAFEGSGPSPWQVVSFLTKARRNIGAFDLPYYLAFP